MMFSRDLWASWCAPKSVKRRKLLGRGERLASAAVCLVFLLATPAFGWGGVGHRHITGGAINFLPLPLRGFFNAHRADVINEAGQEPPGAHYIDIDYYPEFLAGTFPRDVNVLVAQYGSSTVTAQGRGPWTYAGYVTSLTQGMAAAQTPADWEELIPIAAAAAHYIEDLHNPLHTTMNYDGQLTGNNGIHSRYESSMISRKLSELTFAPADVEYLPSVIDFVFDGIEDRYHHVAEIMAADDAAPNSSSTAYYNSLWVQTGAFTKVLFQDATEAVAASWNTAWVNAGSPRTFLESSADFEGDGDVDRFDLTAWKSAYGTTSVADANGDGRSDGNDFLAWQRQLGAAGAVATVAEAPEPSGAMIAATILGFAALARRRSADRR